MGLLCLKGDSAMKPNKKLYFLAVLSCSTLCGNGLWGCADSSSTQDVECQTKNECPANNVCLNGSCVPETYSCTNGKKDAAETDVDCGGGTCNACAIGKLCISNRDCASANCSNGACVEHVNNHGGISRGDILIAEIMNNVQANKAFDKTSDPQTEYFELVNMTDNAIALDGMSISCKRIDTEKTSSFTLQLSDTIQAHNAAVVSNTAISTLPDGVTNPRSITQSGRLVNSATYECDLLANDGTVIHKVWIEENAAGNSAVLEPMFYEISGTKLVEHTTINSRRHSPGYCTNGALYTNLCDTLCTNGKLNDGETDVDCGGDLCEVCSEGKKCLVASDCESHKCIDNVCVALDCVELGCTNGEICHPETGLCFSCSDNQQSGNETDVDCGGLCPTRCTEGQTCLTGSDCDSNQCVEGRCERKSCTLIGCSEGYNCETTTGKCVSCEDHLKNGVETDIDCGGKYCAACADGKQCLVDSDCSSKSCNQGICTSCSDQTQNGTETDVDCGGACSVCSKGQHCKMNSDCSTLECTDGICTGEDLKYATLDDVMINEVYGKRSTSAAYNKFVYNGDATTCEFVEIVNRTGQDLRLNHLKLALQRMDKEAASTKTALPAIIRAKSAMVIHSCADLPLPDNVTELKFTSTSMLVDNVDTYEVYLIDDQDVESPHIEVMVNAYAGISNNRRIDANPAQDMVKHNEVEGAENVYASPGYCANGGLFTEGCKHPCFNGRKDYNETDIDCGGACAAKCALGKRCTANDDCASALCGKDVDASNKEIMACISCNDGRTNGTETGIDCGGDTCGPCSKGSACKLDRDCKSFSCEANKCTHDDCFAPVAGELLITEVMGSPDTNQPFDSTSTTKQNEFVEIVNTGLRRLDLRQATLNYLKSGATSLATVNLSSHEGCLEPHQVFLVTNTSLEFTPNDLPAGVQFLNIMTTAITNSAVYDFYLKTGETEIDRVVRASTSKNGVSQIRDPWNDASATTLKFHNSITTGEQTFKNTPGYCANGGEYVNNCK